MQKKGDTGKTRTHQRAVEVVDGNQGDTCHAEVSTAKHDLAAERKSNSDVSSDGSEHTLYYRSSELSGLTLLKRPIFRLDSSHRINTTPNIAETTDRFVQAGVGYAFLRDSETNTFRPIFPYDCNIAAEIANSWAELDAMKPVDRSKIKGRTPISGAKREKAGGGAKLLVARGGMKSRQRVRRPSQERSNKSSWGKELNQPKKFRFFLEQREDIDKLLNDTEDRRIRTICERFECDLDIYDKRLIAGYLLYPVDISAHRGSSLLRCARNLDSAFGWDIAPQLIGSSLLPEATRKRLNNTICKV